MSAEIRELVGLIPRWLALTSKSDVSVGLPVEEALHKAKALFGLIRRDEVDPSQVLASDTLVDVFHALVSFLHDGTSLADVNAVYQFLDGVAWRDDDFGEKRQLLRQVAILGWRLAGTTLDDVERKRSLDGATEHRSVDAYSTCRLLRERTSVDPVSTLDEGLEIFENANDLSHLFGLFDDRTFRLGEATLVVGTSNRLMGRRGEAVVWLERAAAYFERTVTPSAGLANVGYAFLALDFDSGRHERVLQYGPPLIAEFDRLCMPFERAKCEYVTAKALKSRGRYKEALEMFLMTSLSTSVDLARNLHAMAQTESGDIHRMMGNLMEASRSLGGAASILKGRGCSIETEGLALNIGALRRDMGETESAIVAYRSALSDAMTLGLATRAAYIRLVLAEALVASGRVGEARDEIRKALPTIEEQRMVPEGVAALALLREAARRENADPQALGKWRDFLQRHR